MQLEKNDNRELSMIIDGVRIDFTAVDRSVEDGGEVFGYEIEGENSYINLFSWGGEIDETQASGNGFSTPYVYYLEPENSRTAKTGFLWLALKLAAKI